MKLRDTKLKKFSFINDKPCFLQLVVDEDPAADADREIGSCLRRSINREAVDTDRKR